MFNVIIFGKDRACQAELCIRSLRECFKYPCSITLQYTTSNHFYDEGYEELQKLYPQVKMVKEDGFQDTCKRLIGDCKYTLFLCDDDVFVNIVSQEEMDEALKKFEDEKIHAISLRMSPHITHCYPARKDIHPPLLHRFPNYFTWVWKEAKNQHCCWGYPMAINSHIYRTNDIAPLIHRLNFKDVNSLECQMNHNRFQNKPLLFGFRDTKIFNVQNNFVKDEFNPNDENDHTQAWLNGQFIEGKRISTKNLYGMQPIQCHGKVEYILD